MSELLPEILGSVSGQQLGADVAQANSLDKIPVNQEFAKLLNNSLEHHQVPSGESGRLVSELLQGKDLPFNGKFLPSVSLPLQLDSGPQVTAGIPTGLAAELSAASPVESSVQSEVAETELPGLPLVAINIESISGTTGAKKAGIEQALQQLEGKKPDANEVLSRPDSLVNQHNQSRTPVVPIAAVVSENSVNTSVQNSAAQQVLVRSVLGSQASDVAKARIEEGKVPALANSDFTALHQKATPQTAATRIVLTENFESRFLNNETLPANTTGNSENLLPLTERINSQLNPQLTARFDAMQTLPVSATTPSGAEKLATETFGRTSPELQMQYSINKPEWGSEFSTKIVMMTRQEMPSAYIRMNPAHLGPVEVRISVQNDMASVSFVAHNPAAREAIEGAMPKLREMLDNNGLGLADVDVSDHSHKGNKEQAWEFAAGNNKNSADSIKDSIFEESTVIDIASATTYQIDGHVDYFA